MIENYKIIPIGKAKDLRGQRFNRLIVLDRVENKGKQTQWLCQCDCGNKTIVSGIHLKDNHVQSCGCLKHSPLDDISNQRFGRLVVLNYDHTEGKGHTYWKCKCDCGTEKIIRKDSLISGAIISCGCYHSEKSSQLFSDQLEGQQFNKLIVLQRIGSNKHNNALWLCQCDCGNFTKVTSHDLKSGNIKSCGCLKSQGEAIIKTILNNYNIPFESQKIFNDCRFPETNCLAKFDFYINNTYLIEFDGIQHYSSGTGWNTQEHLEKTIFNDNFKNQWCKKNNIPLIRIPYWHLQDLCINDLKLETTTFLI